MMAAVSHPHPHPQDPITETECNYHVINNHLAWNEYIKKAGRYIELNEFKSTRTRGVKQWSAEGATAAGPKTAPIRFTRASSAAAAMAQREPEKEIMRQAVELAKANVHDAMDLIRDKMIDRIDLSSLSPLLIGDAVNDWIEHQFHEPAMRNV
ncbi:unnamed protein product [Didymodactylos carnosus]|uniref:Uncharacterized protein n=1 Tax=Didymodactylos carnosus TaxID=1234261 RepID=A0A815JS77_9BILA|nr:unnamed protein product [Didymodactylos carnosus]CAF1385938.1 unnamed protein product [Didymodactylos carnosus]CAF3773350.1 unnamed protein product [Didymodactylos carnosus]CAF4280933.1 unnamed protein product [Didymodactylos carnosus]